MNTDWMDQAACAGVDVEVFYPPVGDQDSYRQIRAVYCGPCPVRRECLAFAVAAEPADLAKRHGMFGGLTPAQRHDPKTVAAVLAGDDPPATEAPAGEELERAA
ncbi:MAG: WhiB family transcriptional regulator [Frankia sp.]|nr:WhiB family transcriptional regulator [Frankia sp.]